jgi:NAD(P)H-hydrate epimerase
MDSSGADLWAIASDFADFPQRRPENSHKGTFGHVAILAGSVGYHGAAVLAAEAALKARPGLVTVFTDERCYVPVASQIRAAMVRPWKGEPLDPDEFTAIVAGPGLAAPGLSPALRDEVRRLWRTAHVHMVGDASALDWLGSEAIEERDHARIVTPHPGEAARLQQTDAATIQRDRFSSVRKLAAHWGMGRVTAVLKGRLSLVSDGEGPVWINPTGNPGLAQGGTGDVLSGYLGGILAQTKVSTAIAHAVRFAVWRHGVAADALELTNRAWTTDDLIEALAAPL